VLETIQRTPWRPYGKCQRLVSSPTGGGLLGGCHLFLCCYKPRQTCAHSHQLDDSCASDGQNMETKMTIIQIKEHIRVNVELLAKAAMSGDNITAGKYYDIITEFTQELKERLSKIKRP